ncbi:DNA-binding transcriptional regulator YhcF (GntR family) [Actinoalloteichus hoggarensis]|uniref:HTH-type transcriptional repressor YtrA n=1 Tax=Actinoalloteichus hoggarensis TaxID=1470176 RepID=A0A221VWW4_9PSEU|nr:GntR family transcriptional regulator [Actinoalloteichus hoggarensis]ASO17957.1 HTH-type transcriptional repressor YtrA [Actinoalloteichus hoggarensis]MBB5924369.1 DNA-binding transcriptional regulator YhcF (GntR family) [Actinoalloteichus hoggarensis]
MDLDPDDPRPPYMQVANALRAAILTKVFRPGEKLPSRNELAKRYSVAPMTVQNALRELRDDGSIVSRQGSGVFVRERTERPIGLRPHLERAFEAENVSIDFAGFSGETLHGAMQEPLDKIRIGRLTPKSISVRILVPDSSQPMAIPCRADDLSDSPEFRARMNRIMERHTYAIIDNVTELGRLGLVPEVTAEVRVHRAAPLFKLYLLNGEDAFFGFYPVQEHVLSLGGETTTIYDLAGKDAILFHHSTTDDDTSTGSQYVDQATTWFTSMWTTVGREHVL